jgi:formate dehydrogenase maturation protein FdhE
MVSGDPSQLMFHDRARRARLLADRYDTSREILLFYAGIADWQSEVSSRDVRGLERFFPSLLDLVARTAPDPLAVAARSLGPSDFDRLITEYWEQPGDFSELQFFARALMQPYAAALPEGFDCPWCARPPQVGCLRPQADGLAFEIICALCLRRRAFPRSRCPGCDEAAGNKLSTFAAPDFPNLRIQACDACSGYLQVVDLSRDPSAIPEVDELAGLSLDLWAQQQGYHKLQPNLAGI